MVKADPKHDYYADLELPSTADSETIKKQFRLLAKQYHPDRNQGREIEVIPKFQAIQTANEILSDPTQKKNYDRDRLKIGQDTPDGFGYQKAKKQPPPPPSNFPPPPKRNPNLNRPASYVGSNPRKNASASADKFGAFTRAAPPRWDRAQFDEATKAEAFRNLNNMRGHSQGPPRVPPRAPPTAPRPPSTTPSVDIPQGPGPPPGFPGLSRTNSGRRGFAPGTSTPGDEPPAPPSAYAHVHRSDRPPPGGTGASYSSGLGPSPPTERARPSVSPLRTSGSSTFEDGRKPGLQRQGSRYAASSGERIDINGPGLGRSASVRNSPTRTHWAESGPFGGRAQSQQQQQESGFEAPPSRHHSSSPKTRNRTRTFQFSASETSSSEDEPSRMEDRPKARPRKPQTFNTHGHRPFADDDPALTGQFTRKNYNTRADDERHYHYPPPESSSTSHSKLFSEIPNPMDDITYGLRNSEIGHTPKPGGVSQSQSSQRPNGTSSEPQSATGTTNPAFSAAEWDGKFENGDNVFQPSEQANRSKSPTKQYRQKLASRGRTAARSQFDKENEEKESGEEARTMPGVRHVPGVEENKSFQASKYSAEDWAQRFRGQNSGTPKVPPRQPQVNDEEASETHPSLSEQSTGHRNDNARTGSELDAMDIDESVPQQTRDRTGLHEGPTSSNMQRRQPSSEGVTLDDLKETAPFKPSASGLNDLGDLNSTLPFESRAAEELNLHQPPSTGPAARQLKLPTPPRPVQPPDEMRLTQESWAVYADQMTRYMDAWNIFNCKMIDHFRTRQEQISLAMYHNWLTAVGDGASADDFDGLDFIGSDGSRHDLTNGDTGLRSKPKKAGYATYMQWLKQDRVCRTWWEVALDEHAKCMGDLGRVRKLVKSIRAKEYGKGA